jgi:nitrite reductase/ring-hydroxylating ferredoxin subunit
MARVRAGRLDAFPIGRPVLVVLDGRRLALVRTADVIVHVLDDSCPHAGGPLSEGAVLHGNLICPYHTWFFDLRTGACVEGRPTERVPVYPVVIEGDDVWVDLPDPHTAAGP